MIDAIFMMGGLGLLVGAGLAFASKIFYVYVDPTILAVEAALPGANCGGCGLPGCSANAAAIVAGRAAPNSCVAAGDDVAMEIAAILGVSVEAKEPDIARPGCTYGVARAATKFIYDGLSDCRAASLFSGGMKVCTIGCLGLGSCARACPFGAITMGHDGLPVVDEVRCTGCGTCERVCPKHIITLSSVTRRILKEYKTDECTTPCQRACPAGIDICEYIRQITLGEYHRAVQVIKERNPFPAVIGRICPRPCENECRRQFVDQPVAINFLKRFAADHEKQTGQRILPYKAPATGRRVAVIGGGVAGLSAAFFLARLGHGATVYEATAKLGGLLRSAIAADRLPAEVLDWDIAGVLEMGVKAQTGMALGKNLTIPALFAEGHQAVLLTTGGWDSRLARGGLREVESALPGVHLMLDFIRNVGQDAPAAALRGDTVICGGGRLALEAARVAKTKGPGAVTVVLRETRAGCGIGEADIEALTAENIKFHFNTGVIRIHGEADRLTRLDVVDLVNGEPAAIAAGTLVLASGRLPELVIAAEAADAGNDAAEGAASAPATGAALRWTGVSPYKEAAFHTQTGLFSSGDAFTDYSAAIRAIGAGRRIAASVHEVMYGIPLDLPANVATPDAYIQNVDHVENVMPAARRIMPLCSAPSPAECTEIELGFDEHSARFEAGRCLQCGLICYRQVPEPERKAGG
jgi:formate dehydrogenase (NADP+) beta subunit